MITSPPGPRFSLALVLAAACGPAAPAPGASGTLSIANTSPSAPAGAVACPSREELEELIRSEYSVPAAPLGRVRCIAVRQGGPHWFIDGWRELPPGDPDAGASSRVAVLVDALTQRVVWRDPYGGVGLIAPPPRRTAVDLDGDGRDELVVRSGYPEGTKTLVVEQWTVDDGWIHAGQVAECGLEWPDWRIVADPGGPILEVTCKAGARHYRWSGEELIEVPRARVPRRVHPAS